MRVSLPKYANIIRINANISVKTTQYFGIYRLRKSNKRVHVQDPQKFAKIRSDSSFFQLFKNEKKKKKCGAEF